MEARVSVLMPMFNEERYVRSAVASVLGQTFRELELVVVDDGPSDPSAELVSAGGPWLRTPRSEPSGP